MVEELAEKKLVDKMNFEHWLWLFMTGMLGIDILDRSGPVFGTYIGDIFIMVFFGLMFYFIHTFKLEFKLKMEKLYHDKETGTSVFRSTSPGETPGDATKTTLDSGPHGTGDPERTSE